MNSRLTTLRQQLRAAPAPGVDFQHPNAAHRPLLAVLWLLALALLFNTWQHWQRMEQQQLRTDELEQQFIQLTRRQEQLIQAAIRLSPQQKQQLEAFSKQSQTPFALIDAVAQAWSKEIALTRIEVNTQNQVLHLDLEARALAEAFRFVERLKAKPGVRVSLQQSARKPNDPQHPVQVKLTVGAG
ncbi:hypothetical protein [Pseudomonas sp. KBW05]|uniref:hypothetical protein n=1 Tax=Pseudomonas sp. KBW05 TaxID=2153360 RepID=UPI000F5A9463|nr:hypothetical protein [Pseudomonas sp. KBW05]RQO52981.1 hypothetical protein DBR46_17525 [Pseudomonas sp. KBW05]